MTMLPRLHLRRIAAASVGLVALAIPAATANAGFAGVITATASATPTSVEVPGTFSVTGTFQITTPFDGLSTMKVTILLSGTSGLALMDTPTPSAGLSNCLFTTPNRGYTCDVTDPTVIGTYTLTANVSATGIPVSNTFLFSARASYGAANAATSPDVVIDLTSPPANSTVPPTTTAAPTTTAVGAGGGDALPGVGSDRTLAYLGTSLVALGGLMLLLRRRPAAR